MSILEERVCEVFLKSTGMLKAMEELRNDKMALEVRLLRRLEELKKVLDDISSLQEVASRYRRSPHTSRRSLCFGLRSIGNAPRS